MRAAVIGAAGLLVGAAYYYATQTEQASTDTASQDSTGTTGATGNANDTITDTLNNWSQSIMSVFSLSRMADVTRADVAHPNVQAFLAVIRRGEGTTGPNGYRTLFGGGLFDSFADHPRKAITRTLSNGKTITSTAAGAYQFLASTWDETRAALRLGDFSPAAQDWAAVARIAARGALEDVKAGRFADAIQKTAREWASLPGSPYGQPVISMATAQNTYTTNGGTFA